MLFVLLGCLNVFATQFLQIRWRSWMTGDFLRRWLADRAYYRISIAADAEGVATDNPDQRLSDDIAAFTGAGANARPDDDTLSLADRAAEQRGLAVQLRGGALGAVAHGAAVRRDPCPAAWSGWRSPSAPAAPALTFLVGRRLIPLFFLQQRREADFRFALVRVRENTEGIALHDGRGRGAPARCRTASTPYAATSSPSCAASCCST